MQPLSCHALTRVVIADDHAVVRAGIKAVLEGLDEVAVVGEARDGAELVQQVDRLLPDVALADISMPGMDGISAVAAIHRTHPSVRLIMLSMVDDTDSVRQAVAAGATGYLVKDSPSSRSSTHCGTRARSVRTSVRGSPRPCCERAQERRTS